MSFRRCSPLHLLRRRLPLRLLASTLLVLQILATALIAAHSIGHADATRIVVAAAAHDAHNATSVFARLFGHELGIDCDDWIAAFAPDRDASSKPASNFAGIPSVGDIAASPAASPRPSAFTLFLARGPPNRLSTT